MDVGQVTVTQDLCLGIFPFESLEQVKQCSILSGGPGVGVMAVLVEASLITHGYRTAIETAGVHTLYALWQYRNHRAVAPYIVVI